MSQRTTDTSTADELMRASRQLCHESVRLDVQSVRLACESAALRDRCRLLAEGHDEVRGARTATAGQSRRMCEPVVPGPKT